MSSQVMTAVRTLPLVPTCTFFAAAAFGVWCLTVAMYLQTSATLQSDKVMLALDKADSAIGQANDQYNQIAGNEPATGSAPTPAASGSTSFSAGSLDTTPSPTVTPGLDGLAGGAVTFLQDNNAKDILQLYNLFGFLWTMGFIKAICFMILAFIAVFWYFSVPGDDKQVPLGSVLRATRLVFRYHLGTVAFGSFIVAVIQFIRFLLSRVQKKLEEQAENPTIKILKFLMSCVQCCLAYWERVIKYINKNGYIVCCITGKSFCPSAKMALDLILDNLAQLGAATFIADWVLIFCKVLMTVLNLFIAYVLLTKTSLAEGVSVILIPMFVVGFVSYIVSSLYMHVFDAVIDTLMLCFCYDKAENNGIDKPYYFTSDLSKLIGKYNAPDYSAKTVVPVAGNENKADEN